LPSLKTAVDVLVFSLFAKAEKPERIFSFERKQKFAQGSSIFN
jgi:hypothetical protein